MSVRSTAAVRGRGGGRDYRRQFLQQKDIVNDAKLFIQAAQQSAQRRKYWELAKARGLPTDSPLLSKFRGAAFAALAQKRKQDQLEAAKAAQGPKPPRAGEIYDELSRVKRHEENEKLLTASRVSKARKEIYATFNDPSKNTLAKLINMVSLILIAVSTAAFVLETIPELSERKTQWDTIEIIVVAFFTVEYVSRLLTCPDIKEFATSILNLVDLIAILPFYLELGLESNQSTDSSSLETLTNLRVLRAVRLMRVFRVFKMSKHSVHFQLLMDTLSRSYDALMVLVFILVIAIIIFAGAIYFLEKGQYDPYEELNERLEGFGWGIADHRDREKSYYEVANDMRLTADPFESIPSSCWWAIVTMTTVGYGDARPVTLEGKLIASICMLIGILVVALPVTIVGSAFSEVYREHKHSVETEVIANCLDPTLQKEGFVNLISQFSSKRQALLHVFLAVERIVAQHRFQGQKYTHRPWTLAEQAMLDTVAHNLLLLQDFLTQGAIVPQETVEADGLVVKLGKSLRTLGSLVSNKKLSRVADEGTEMARAGVSSSGTPGDGRDGRDGAGELDDAAPKQSLAPVLKNIGRPRTPRAMSRTPMMSPILHLSGRAGAARHDSWQALDTLLQSNKELQKLQSVKEPPGGSQNPTPAKEPLRSAATGLGVNTNVLRSGGSVIESGFAGEGAVGNSRTIAAPGDRIYDSAGGVTGDVTGDDHTSGSIGGASNADETRAVGGSSQASNTPPHDRRAGSVDGSSVRDDHSDGSESQDTLRFGIPTLKPLPEFLGGAHGTKGQAPPHAARPLPPLSEQGSNSDFAASLHSPVPVSLLPLPESLPGQGQSESTTTTPTIPGLATGAAAGNAPRRNGGGGGKHAMSPARLRPLPPKKSARAQLQPPTSGGMPAP